MRKNVKTKVDGKYLTIGNLIMGEKGERLGLRVTEEFRKMVNGAEPGSWLNFLVYPDDRVKEVARQNQQAAASTDDGIPF